LLNYQSLKRASDSQPKEEGSANYTREELYEMFRKLNLSLIIPEPPLPNYSGSGDDDDQSGVTYNTN